MKNITFFFSSRLNINTGNGGAYFDLLTYKNILSEEFDTKLIHFNSLKQKTVIDQETDLVLCPHTGKHQNHQKLKLYFKEVRPVVFISFTNHPLTLYIRWLCWLHKCKFIYAKAGGPNYYLKQFFQNVIFFSKENYFFTRGSRNVNAFVVTNRIDPIFSNETRLQHFKLLHASLAKDAIKIVRVSRVNRAYLPVFLATANLHKSLRDKGFPVITHLIGHEEDESVSSAIKEAIAALEGIHFYSDEYYTHNTKELIPFYDVVIGIGRGFWEGVACDKLTLGYANNSEFPVLVTRDNVELFKDLNFSTRVNLPKAETFVDNTTVFTSPDKRAEYIRFLKSEFDDNYSTTTLAARLKKVIDESRYETFTLLFKSIVLVIYTTYIQKAKGYLRSKKSIRNFTPRKTLSLIK